MNDTSVSVDVDPIFDYSHSTDGGKATPFQLCCKSCKNKLTLKNLTFQQYQYLIFFTIACNSISLILESCYLIQLKSRHDISNTYYSVIPLVVTILSGLNVMLLLKLTQRPTTQATLGSLGIMICLIVAYVTQACIHYIGVYGSAAEVSVVVIFIVIQVFSAIMLYRFWEMILYNYDESTVSGSVRNSIISSDGLAGDSGNQRNQTVTNALSGALSAGALQSSSANSGSLQLKKALTSASHMNDAPEAQA